MARIARLVVPGLPHHVTQRGNRRGQVIFADADYELYEKLPGEAEVGAGAEVWAYCLMPNHVHIILTPSDEDRLRSTFTDLHHRYTGVINARNRWTGHLWQGRFGSAPIDEQHLIAAVRYVALNPVRARLVRRAQDWPWSSVRGWGYGDGVGRTKPQPHHNRQRNKNPNDFMNIVAHPKGLEPLAPRFVVWCSIQLSYGCP